MKFFIMELSSKLETADLVTFTEKNPKRKTSFFCAVITLKFMK